MFIHRNEGDATLSTSWQTQSRPGQPGSEVNRIDEKANYECSPVSEETDECVGGICSLNWKPQPRAPRDAA